MTTYRLISLASFLLVLAACGEDNVECRTATDCSIDGHICLDNRCQDYPRPNESRTPPGGGVSPDGDAGADSDPSGTSDVEGDIAPDTSGDAAIEDAVTASCADLTVSPATLNMGSNNPGQDLTDTLVIRNNGTLPIVVSSVFVPTPFNIREPTLSEFPVLIAAGRSLTATVALVVGSGSQTSSVEVATDVCSLDIFVRGSTE